MSRTFLPRFKLRTILAITTACAVLFLLVGTGYRGKVWAWGAAIGILSLGLTALVHVACYGVVWCFAQLSASNPQTGSDDTAKFAPAEATK